MPVEETEGGGDDLGVVEGEDGAEVEVKSRFKSFGRGGVDTPQPRLAEGGGGGGAMGLRRYRCQPLRAR